MAHFCEAFLGDFQKLKLNTFFMIDTNVFNISLVWLFEISETVLGHQW